MLDAALEFASPRVLAMAKAMWATRQSAYLLTAMAARKEGPTLKDWDDVPDSTKLWMCNEARAAEGAYQAFERAALLQSKEEGEGR